MLGKCKCWKMSSLSKSSLLFPNKISPSLGIFGGGGVVPLCRCHVITDKSPITAASTSGYESETRDSVSFTVFFLFDIL